MNKEFFYFLHIIVQQRTIHSVDRTQVLEDSIDEAKSTTVHRTFRARAAVFCERHLEDSQEWIKKSYAQKDMESLGKNANGTTVEAQTIIVKNNSPILIYNPAWINSPLKWK